MGLEHSISSPKQSSMRQEHKGLVEIAKIASVEELELRRIRPEIKDQISAGLNLYPKSMRPREILTIPPAYQTLVLRSNEQGPGQGGNMVFFLSGAPGTALQDADAMVALFKELQSKLPGQGPLTEAAISSSASIDTGKLPMNHLERAAYQAAFMVEMLEKYQPDIVHLVGNSMGGMELLYAVPMIKWLMQQRGLDTKIGGIVLYQSAGLLKQDPGSFITNSLPQPGVSSEFSVPKLKKNIAEVFPSLVDNTGMLDVGVLGRELEGAYIRSDHGAVMRIKKQLANLRLQHEARKSITLDEKRAVLDLSLSSDKLDEEQKALLDKIMPKLGALNFEALTEAEKLKLIQIDLKIEDALLGAHKALEKLQKQRYDLLLPVVKRMLLSADSRTEEPSMLTWGRLGLFALSRGGLTDIMPADLRSVVDAPVAIVVSIDDAYFPKDKVEAGLVDQRIAEKAPIFHNSPTTYLASIDKHPHAAIGSNPRRFAEVTGDLIARMSKSDDSQKTGEIIRVWY